MTRLKVIYIWLPSIFLTNPMRPIDLSSKFGLHLEHGISQLSTALHMCFRTNPNVVVLIYFVLVVLSAVYSGKKLKAEKSGRFPRLVRRFLSRCFTVEEKYFVLIDS